MPITKPEFIARVGELEKDYQPSDATVAQLREVDLTTVSAGVAMGKNSVMYATRLHVVVGDTIRDKRVNNGVREIDGREYYFVGGELQRVIDDVEAGGYVQIGTGPNNNSFYGTRACAYPSEGPALLEVLPRQIEAVRSLPFKSLESAYVVPPSYESWHKRALTRGMTHEVWLGRLAEARVSLGMALDDENMLFILNAELPVAAASLARFANNRERDDSAHKVAKQSAAQILRELTDAA
jgi:guanylate kinase